MLIQIGNQIVNTDKIALAEMFPAGGNSVVPSDGPALVISFAVAAEIEQDGTQELLGTVVTGRPAIALWEQLAKLCEVAIPG